MENHFDIVVVGGGFAGTCAAIAAAREGKSVLLVEKYNCLGGAASFDLVNPFMNYWTNVPDENGKKERSILSAGIFSEIIEQLKAMGAMSEQSLVVFQEEYLKLILNRLVIQSGVALMFHATVTSAQVQDGYIKSVEISHIGGKSTVYAECFIDATGDANLTMLSGFPFKLGREADSLCQPMTLCFRLSNVDVPALRKDAHLISPLYQQLQREGKIKNPREDVLLFYTDIPGVVHFNTTRVVKRNPTDVMDVTLAEIEAREQVFEMIDFLRENFSCFADCHLISTGLQIGARESRMICGLHTLNEEEMKNCTKFKDGIAACNYDIDIHSPDGSGTSHYYFPDGCYYTIPYRCLIPISSRNLLVAGRCISATHEGQASLRIMPTCATLGQAAGTAAAMCINENKEPKDIDTDALREILRNNGAVVD